MRRDQEQTRLGMVRALAERRHVRALRSVLSGWVAVVVLAACATGESERGESVKSAAAAPVAAAGQPAADRAPGTTPGAEQAVAPELEAELAAIRIATERYRDVDAALAAGYVRDPSNMCYDAAMEGQPRQLGGMGIHFVRPDLVGVTAMSPRVRGTGVHTDFREPGLLVYAPRPDGGLDLVAVENLIFVEGWEASGHSAPPTFFGNEYYRVQDNPDTEVDEAHGFAPHYELHIYLYRDNPNGLFAPFNPNVSCEHHRPSGAPAHH